MTVPAKKQDLSDPKDKNRRIRVSGKIRAYPETKGGVVTEQTLPVTRPQLRKRLRVLQTTKYLNQGYKLSLEKMPE
ncbi:hypothetical protein HOLleu_14353 [Holothuria leucospilota]|uniref:Uncharacterized protein n=1 Tax=Holothuria leucospilota TaxID=206669 RepID=A0A9Q1HC96_HOLLE|nr:hypothetical protein HOLleu_14353 [Holothuria leucospilota]